MKRLRSINIYYLMGTIPFCIGIICMSLKLAGAAWQKFSILFAGAAVIGWIVKKFWYLPRPGKDYGEMEPYDLKLPGGFYVKTYLCPQMDKYGFLKRNVEIISPLIKNRKEPFAIALSPEFMKKAGEDTMRIAVMREIIRYRQAVQAKSSLGLVTPVLMAACLVEGYFVFGWDKAFYSSRGLLNFFAPVLIMLLTIGFLLLWNSRISQMDYKVDEELKQYFSKENITDYIVKWDQLLLPDEPELINEKSRELEKFYIKQRIERL